jgi:hypothetical protein
MLVLFDNGTPRTLARYLIGHHTITEARARGWGELENGELLTVAEAAGFEMLVTTDRNLRYQQNLAGRKIAIVVLGKGRWSIIQPCRGGCCRNQRRDAGQLHRNRDTGISRFQILERVTGSLQVVGPVAKVCRRS